MQESAEVPNLHAVKNTGGQPAGADMHHWHGGESQRWNRRPQTTRARESPTPPRPPHGRLQNNPAGVGMNPS